MGHGASWWRMESVRVRDFRPTNSGIWWGSRNSRKEGEGELFVLPGACQGRFVIQRGGVLGW